VAGDRPAIVAAEIEEGIAGDVVPQGDHAQRVLLADRNGAGPFGVEPDA
jgi:hypothetical protein